MGKENKKHCRKREIKNYRGGRGECSINFKQKKKTMRLSKGDKN